MSMKSKAPKNSKTPKCSAEKSKGPKQPKSMGSNKKAKSMGPKGSKYSCPPLSPATSSPTFAPSPAPVCDISLAIDCELASGAECQSFVFPKSCFESTSTLTEIIFKYKSRNCAESDNVQPGITCADSLIAPSDPLTSIACTSNVGFGTNLVLTPSSNIPSGSQITATWPGGGPIQDSTLTCTLVGGTTQILTINVGTSPLRLGDKFGALTIYGCGGSTCADKETATLTSMVTNQASENSVDIVSGVGAGTTLAAGASTMSAPFTQKINFCAKTVDIAVLGSSVGSVSSGGACATERSYVLVRTRR